ncbi:MAG: dihydrofolate reductase family protein [Succinivibrio sp.]|nr:dihydrofolate reductase family protein [Succinivibrio sp.]
MEQTQNRPKVICLMETSVDGRIDEKRWSELYDEKGEGDPDVYYETLNSIQADANLLGRVTVQKHYVKQIFSSNTHTQPTELSAFRGIRKTPELCVVFDSAGLLCYQDDLLDNRSVVAMLGSTIVSEEYLTFLRSKEISYTFAGADGHDCRLALESLYQDFGIKTVRLLGGGILNGSFLRLGLIDELYTIIYPGIDGLSGINSLFEYRGQPTEQPCEGQKLELLECREVRAGVVLLHYQIHHA